MLRIYPFLSTISPQSLAGFPIFESLVVAKIVARLCQGRELHHLHTRLASFLRPPSWAGTWAFSLLSPRARGAWLLRLGAPGRAASFGPSGALGIAPDAPEAAGSARTATFGSAHLGTVQSNQPQDPTISGGWVGRETVGDA